MGEQESKNFCAYYLTKFSIHFDFDFDDTRFRSLQSKDHVEVLKTETDWPRWSEDGANQIVIVTI